MTWGLIPCFHPRRRRRSRCVACWTLECVGRLSRDWRHTRDSKKVYTGARHLSIFIEYAQVFIVLEYTQVPSSYSDNVSRGPVTRSANFHSTVTWEFIIVLKLTWESIVALRLPENLSNPWDYFTVTWESIIALRLNPSLCLALSRNHQKYHWSLFSG